MFFVYRPRVDLIWFGSPIQLDWASATNVQQRSESPWNRWAGLNGLRGVGWYLVGGCVAECVIVAVVFVFVFVFCFCCCCDDVMSPACQCVSLCMRVCKMQIRMTTCLHLLLFNINHHITVRFCCCSRWIIWALPLSLAPFPMQILIRAAKVNVLSLLFLFLFLFSCQQVSYWTTFTLPTWRKSCHPPPFWPCRSELLFIAYFAELLIMGSRTQEG